ERRLRLEAQPIVTGKIDQRLKRPRIERAGHLEDIGIFDSDAAAQQLAEVGRRLALDLESQRLPGASLSQLQLEAPHVISRTLILEQHVRVARDAKAGGFDDPMA